MKRAMSMAIAVCVWAWLAPGAGFGPGPAAGAAAGPGGKMPGKVVIGDLSKDYGPVAFDHAAHVGMASGCNDCHHQHGRDKTVSCKGCHAVDDAGFKKAVNFTGFKPCKGCHAAARGGADDLGKPDLRSAYHRACFRCHRGEVGTVGKDPKGCAEMCHSIKDKTN